ncbi:MAG: heme-binding protein, partial [Syntrophobacteraceae bacterium]
MKIRFYSIWIPTLLAMLLVTGSARAQDVLTESQVSLALAQEAARAAVEQCRADGFQVTAAVVDRAGNLKALIRDDGAGPLSVDSARRKAFTSSLFRSSTSALVARAADPAAANLQNITDGLLFLGGGLPITVGGEVVGGIGVGGAPSGAQD